MCKHPTKPLDMVKFQYEFVKSFFPQVQGQLQAIISLLLDILGWPLSSRWFFV